MMDDLHSQHRPDPGRHGQGPMGCLAGGVGGHPHLSQESKP
jgi:hypothetical protein